ncbi:MAG: hypothetical protein ACK56W_14625 [Pirellula sp.]|jgi:hypothetical protein
MKTKTRYAITDDAIVAILLATKKGILNRPLTPMDTTDRANAIKLDNTTQPNMLIVDSYL